MSVRNSAEVESGSTDPQSGCTILRCSPTGQASPTRQRKVQTARRVLEGTQRALVPVQCPSGHIRQRSVAVGFETGDVVSS